MSEPVTVPVTDSAPETPASSSAPEGGVDWGSLVETLPEDLRPSIEGNGYKDFESFAKGYVDLSSKVGKPRVPSAEERSKWTDAQRAEFQDAMGFPKEAGEYGLEEFRWPDLGEDAGPLEQTAATLTNTLVDRFAQYAAERRMPREEARAAVEFYRNFAEDLSKVRVQSREAKGVEIEKRHLGKYGGDEGFEKAKGLATRGAEAVFGERLALFRTIELPDGTGLLDNPEFFDLLVEAGRSLEEGSLPGAKGAESTSVSGAKEKLDALMADPEKRAILEDSSHPQHEALVAERLRLYQQIRNASPQDYTRSLMGPQGLNPDGSHRPR